MVRAPRRRDSPRRAPRRRRRRRDRTGPSHLRTPPPARPRQRRPRPANRPPPRRPRTRRRGGPRQPAGLPKRGGTADRVRRRRHRQAARSAPPGRVDAARLIAAASRPGGRIKAEHAVIAAADLLAWADRHDHPTGSPAAAHDPQIVDAWAAPDGAGRWAPTTRNQRLRWLRQAARDLPPDDPTLDTRHSARPYARDELDALDEWARHAVDLCQRQAAVNGLALAPGTGLPVRDLLAVTGDRVLRDPTTGAVLVTAGTGPTARTVVCMAEHEDAVLAAARAAGPRWIVDADQAAPAVDRLAFVLAGPPPAPGVPKATARRCRATWIRAQLASGTRLDTVLRAAGVSSQSCLDEWTRYLPPLTGTERRALLRGA